MWVRVREEEAAYRCRIRERKGNQKAPVTRYVLCNEAVYPLIRRYHFKNLNN